MCDGRRKPKIQLGRRLAATRKRIVASGKRLLGWDELDAEVQERRGEWIPRCTNCGTNEATIIEAGVCICQDCAEDNPQLQQPVIEARKAERDFQEWKDVKDGT